VTPDQWAARRGSFDTMAPFYQQARPEYPAALFDELIRLTGVRAGDRLLEVGCGPGKATLPLARRGFRITCLERGGELAAAARENLAAFGGVEVVGTAFEDWRPPAGTVFDLVFAANAWLWTAPETRYQRAAALLRPGGHLAFWGATHVFPPDGDPIFKELQDVYDEIGEGDSAPRHAPGELPDQRAGAEASGLFGDLVVRQFDWEITYDVDSYLRLLDSFSNHALMADWQRDRLYGEIRRRLADRPDGTLRRHWGSVLHIATRL